MCGRRTTGRCDQVSTGRPPVDASTGSPGPHRPYAYADVPRSGRAAPVPPSLAREAERCSPPTEARIRTGRSVPLGASALRRLCPCTIPVLSNRTRAARARVARSCRTWEAPRCCTMRTATRPSTPLSPRLERTHGPEEADLTVGSGLCAPSIGAVGSPPPACGRCASGGGRCPARLRCFAVVPTDAAAPACSAAGRAPPRA